MTQEEIIAMAREAVSQITIQANGDVFYSFYGKELEAFAKLVAAHEREQIEKLFEELSDNTEPHKDYEDYDDGWMDACNACKWAVADRGEQQ